MGESCGTRGGRGEVRTGVRWGNLSERDHVKDLGIDVRIISECILNRLGGHLLDFSASEQEQTLGFFKYCNELRFQ